MDTFGCLICFPACAERTAAGECVAIDAVITDMGILSMISLQSHASMTSTLRHEPAFAYAFAYAFSYAFGYAFLNAYAECVAYVFGLIATERNFTPATLVSGHDWVCFVG
jgi:hypothetical protein